MKKIITLTLVALLSLNVVTTKGSIIVAETTEDETKQELVENKEEIVEENETEEIIEGVVEEELQQEEVVEEEIIEENETEEVEESQSEVEEENEIISEELEENIDNENQEEKTEDYSDVELDRVVVGNSLLSENKEDEEELLEAPQLLCEYVPTEEQIDGFFTINKSSFEYNGKIQVPEIKLVDCAPNFNYHVDFEIVSADHGRLITIPINAGYYILRAKVSYSPAKTPLGELIFHKTRIVEFGYEIVPKDINELTLSELTYNGEVQYPTIFAGDDKLVGCIDYEYVDIYEEDTDHISATNADGNIIHKVDVKLYNYTVNGESNVTVEYKINKRSLDIQDEIRYAYTGDVITPELSATHCDETINIDNFVSSITFVDNVPQEVAYQYPGEYTALVTFDDDFLFNNEINEVDAISDDEYYTVAIPACIDRATINYDFKALYYNGQNQYANITYTGVDGSDLTDKIEILKDSDGYFVYDADGYLCKNGYSAVGNYYIYVAMDPDVAKYYVWPDYIVDSENPLVAKIGYRINKSSVEFAGWDFDSLDTDNDGVVTLTGSLLSVSADFIYTMDGDTLCLEYNGFNPFLFRDADGNAPIPGASYKYSDSDVIIEDINRYDYEFYPEIPSEALKLGVGTYYSRIVLNNDCYGTNNARTKFKVVPKLVTLNWTKTIIDITDSNLNPECEIVGLAPIDQIGFRLVKTEDGIDWITTDKLVVEFGNYYKYNSPEDSEPQVVAYYPVKYKPTEEGRYKVDVKNIVYSLTGFVDKNYIIADTSVNYVIVDKSTIKHDGHIYVGTDTNDLNKNVIAGIELETPSENDMLSVISKLAETDTDGAAELLAALNSDKNVNVYLVAKNVENTSGLILPTNNCVIVDLELFAYVEGSNKQYQLHDTGTYKFGVDVTLTKAQADDLGYGPGKCFYIARYHGDSVTPDYTQMVDPIVSGTGDATTYTFRLSSNKFSDFAIYTGNKPIDIETDDHIVPYTGE